MYYNAESFQMAVTVDTFIFSLFSRVHIHTWEKDNQILSELDKLILRFTGGGEKHAKKPVRFRKRKLIKGENEMEDMKIIFYDFPHRYEIIF